MSPVAYGTNFINSSNIIKESVFMAEHASTTNGATMTVGCQHKLQHLTFNIKLETGGSWLSSEERHRKPMFSFEDHWQTIMQKTSKVFVYVSCLQVSGRINDVRNTEWSSRRLNWNQMPRFGKRQNNTSYNEWMHGKRQHTSYRTKADSFRNIQTFSPSQQRTERAIRVIKRVDDECRSQKKSKNCE